MTKSTNSANMFFPLRTPLLLGRMVLYSTLAKLWERSLVSWCCCAQLCMLLQLFLVFAVKQLVRVVLLHHIFIYTPI